jgi:hypothetical protein
MTVLKKNISVSENGFLFDATTGESYSVNETGADIIRLLNEGKSEEAIRDTFLNEYKVEPLVFERNFYEFTNLLKHMGLVL